MYESPINRLITEIQTEFNNKDEKCLMATIKQNIGYEVDKDELFKALAYDRKQYEKGLHDHLHAVWQYVNPMVDTIECSNCGYQLPSIELVTPFCAWCGREMTNYNKLVEEGEDE